MAQTTDVQIILSGNLYKRHNQQINSNFADYSSPNGTFFRLN